jgi:peptidoglycan/LPS O-acetylase OafA/YrhL
MELVFYALAPWFVRRSALTLGILAGASIALRFAGHLLPVDYGIWQGRLFPTACFLFLLGMLSQRAMRFATVSRTTGVLANVALLSLIVALPHLHLADELGRVVLYAAVTAALPFVFRTFQEFRWDRWIGDLSYPVYLTHLMVIGVVLTFTPPMPTLVALAGTLALSAVFLQAIDRPVDRWRQQRIERASRRAPGAGRAVCGEVYSPTRPHQMRGSGG